MVLNSCMDVDVYDVNVSPLGPNNNFLMYADALVINKALQLSKPVSRYDIETLMKLYSRLTTHLTIAFQ